MVFSLMLLLALSPAGPSGPYLGEKSPGATPALFAPGIVSTGLYERDLAVTRDGKEFIFSLMGARYSVLVACKEQGGRWTSPEVLPFSGGPVSMDVEPAFSPDGQRLYFLSTRPKDGGAPKPGWANQDIWVVTREGSSWGTPEPLGEAVNSAQEEFFPSLAQSGNLYFIRVRDEGKVSAIWRARPSGQGFQKAERLPDIINGAGPAFNAAISPDETRLVFCAADRKGGLGVSDYWISFRSPDDHWCEPANLGAPFNGPRLQAISPAFSADGKYFFFATNRRVEPRTTPHTYADLQKSWTSPGNGNSDIYWVDVAVLRALKPKDPW